MALNLNVNIGRARPGGGVGPGYIAQMRAQVNAIKVNLKKVLDRIENASPEALKYAVKPIFDTSQQLVPKDTLRLMRSGYLEVHRLARSGGVSVNIGYGKGGNPPYAAIVHERLDTHHKGGTQAKYLEAAVNQKVHLILPRYKRYIQQQTGLSD